MKADDTFTVNCITHKQSSMYIIGSGGSFLLYDSLWQDSFPVIRGALKELAIPFANIAGLVVSHFHPDHAGCVEFLRRHGVELLITEEQLPHVAWLNTFFQQSKNDPHGKYVSVAVAELKPYTLAAATAFIQACGIDGRIIHTPGHSADGVSLVVGKTAFVGDLPPWEIAAAFASEVSTSWNDIIGLGVTEYYHAHAGHKQIDS